MSSSFALPQRGGEAGVLTSAVGEAQGRLAQIMAEVAATPVESFFPKARTQPRRDPAAALRWFMVADFVALTVGFLVAWGVAAFANLYVLDRSFPFLEGTDEILQIVEFCGVSVGVLLWFGHTGHYRQRMPLWSEIQKVVNALGFAMIVNGFFLFASKQDVSRLWLMSGWIFAAAGMIALRSVSRAVLRRRGMWQVRTLLVGSGAVADEARIALRSERGLGYEIAMQVENLPMLLEATGGSWQILCDRFNADYVVIALDGQDLVKADEAIAALVRAGIPFSVSPPLRNMPVLGMTAQCFFNNDTILMSPVNNLEQALPRFFKRAMDVVGSGLALVVLSPFFLVLCLMVKRDGGPAIFGHDRIGMNGRTFKCLKFRSMVLNADKALSDLLAKNEAARAEWNATQKLKDDPRVTKIGAVMRRLSLDELPQLINVFKGDMSLVGPRPVVLAETLRYQKEIAFYYRVRPGLTGLWQVSGRSDVSFQRRVQMDSWYVRNWSLWHDIAIICKTFPVVFNRTGAY